MNDEYDQVFKALNVVEIDEKQPENTINGIITFYVG